jgi:hypothetical protein
VSFAGVDLGPNAKQIGFLDFIAPFRESILMRPLAPGSVLAVALSIASLVSARADDKPKWTMMTDKNQVSLIYGDGSEESDLILSCKPHSNSVRFFIGETDASLRPKMQVTATFTVGAAKAAVPGKTVPNELAGVPSFIGELTATDPLFDAMTGAPAISLKVAKTAKEIPLKTMGSKAGAFSKACRKS